MPFELLISLRYLLAKRKQVFISVISAISTLGVIVGVMILLIALAIMTGFQGELRSRILGAASHLSVYSLRGRGISDYRRVVEVLHSLPGIEGATPALYGKALVSSATGSGLVTLKGVDPVREAGVTEFAGKMVAGSLESLVKTSNGSDTREGSLLPGVVVGEALALTLGCLVGDSVNVTSPEGHLTPFGILPRSRRFQVVGIYRVGLYDFDNSWALVGLRDAQRLLGFADEAIYVETRVEDIYAVKELGEEARRALGNGYGTLDWMEMNSSLFSALWLEKMVTTIFISFIVGVAALNIVASQMMIVMEKTRDIAILPLDGCNCPQHHDHLHAARIDRRGGRHVGGHRLGSEHLLGTGSLSGDQHSAGCLPGGFRAVQASTYGSSVGRLGGAAGLFRGYDLSSPSGLSAQPDGGSAV